MNAHSEAIECEIVAREQGCRGVMALYTDVVARRDNAPDPAAINPLIDKPTSTSKQRE
jgi:hypothetical protein